MEYYGILQLDREPFSNSPDPDFFFQSREHRSCLQKLELSLRMRRGLNVVVGEVGSGKTTLCRQLLRNFADNDRFSPHLILHPQFETEKDFLRTVVNSLEGIDHGDETSILAMKEQIKQHLFQKGVEEEKIVVLIIDEGQKIPRFCLEILREFLNYETNTYKLLQIVIFAQCEFETVLAGYDNFADRINLFHRLGPLGFSDTRAMIRFRIRQACDAPDSPGLFSGPAVWAIHRGARGYPRKIIHLCHQCLLAMIVQNREKVDWFIARACVRRRFRAKSAVWKKTTAAATLASLAVLLWFSQTGFEISIPGIQTRKAATSQIQATGKTYADNPVLGNTLETRPSVQTRGTNRTETSFPKTELLDKVIPAPLAEAAEIKNSENPSDEKSVAAVAEKTPKIQKAINESDPETTANKPEPAMIRFNENPDPGLPPDAGMVGTAKAGFSEPLSEMIQKVYGLFDKTILARVLAANPQITNPDKIMAGQKIRFPCIIAREKPLAIGRCWIEFARYNTLDRALRSVRSLPASADFSARLIPIHTPRDGYQFSVIVKEYFASKSDAQFRLDELRNQLGPQASVLAHWDPDTVFYSDPYSGRIRQ